MKPSHALRSRAGNGATEPRREEAEYFRRLLNAAVSHPGAVGAPRRGTSTGWCEPRGDDAVNAQVAGTPTLRHDAAALVGQRYAWRGYATRDATSDVEVPVRDETTLVAIVEGRVAGTMTLGLDGPGGLWIDQAYAAETSRRRAAGAALCELTRLAVAPGHNTRALLAALFDLAYETGRRDRGATDLYVEVHPRHAPFYRRLFGFEIVSGVRECDRVRAPAVLMHLDIAQVDASLLRFIARRAATLPGLEQPASVDAVPVCGP